MEAKAICHLLHGVGLLGQHFGREELSSSPCQTPSSLHSAVLHLDKVSLQVHPSLPLTFTQSVITQSISPKAHPWRRYISIYACHELSPMQGFAVCSDYMWWHIWKVSSC